MMMGTRKMDMRTGRRDDDGDEEEEEKGGIMTKRKQSKRISECGLKYSQSIQLTRIHTAHTHTRIYMHTHTHTRIYVYT